MSNKMKNMRAALLFFIVAVISLGVSAQNVTVKGTVKDKTGETVIGASVVEKGNTTNGTITDIDGNYSLNVPSNATLVFSFVGMRPTEVQVKGQTQINVTMEDDTQTLDEVVVIGYGTVSKRDLTGSVASVSSEQLTAVPVSSASEALTGKLAGVNITTTEGSPDADIKIRVRGGGSLSQDNSPLYIVDGFPVSSISDIAPSEIQSIDVLKDASSTAIYGARGANGVIIVTTKSGREGKTQVDFNASYGFKKVTKLNKVMSPYDYAAYQYELGSTDYGNYQDLDIWRSVEGTDFQDEIFGRTGNQTQYNVNVSGGTTGASNITVRSHIEKDYNTVEPNQPGYDAKKHVFPGDLLPSKTAYEANETYSEDPSIVCKIYHKDSIPFMTAFETGTEFFNSRSLTETHYLIWGYNGLEYLKNYPFITVKAVSA